MRMLFVGLTVSFFTAAAAASPAAGPAAQTPAPMAATTKATTPAPTAATTKATTPAPTVATTKAPTPAPAVATTKATTPAPTVATTKATTPAPTAAPTTRYFSPLTKFSIEFDGSVLIKSPQFIWDGQAAYPAANADSAEAICLLAGRPRPADWKPNGGAPKKGYLIFLIRDTDTKKIKIDSYHLITGDKFADDYLTEVLCE